MTYIMGLSNKAINDMVNAARTTAIATAAADATAKANAAKTKTFQAVGATDITIASATYVDMPSMTLTFTAIAGEILVLFNAEMRANQAAVFFSMEVDGAPLQTGKLYPVDGDLDCPCAMMCRAAVTAGSHTVKIRWKLAAGAVATQYGATYGQRVLTVLNIPS